MITTIPYRILIINFLVLALCNVFRARCNVFSGDTVPVLLWGSSSEIDSRPSPVNPLLKTSQAEFNQILSSKTDNSQPPVIVFVKDSLCVEDLTQHNKELRQMTNRSLLAYLPAVESPLSVLEDLSSYNQSYNDNIDSILDGQLVFKQIISLDTIYEVYRSIKDSSPNLIAALTGRLCGYSRSERVRRATEENNSATFTVRSDRVLLFASQFPYVKTAEDKEFVQLPSMSWFEDHTIQTNNINLRIMFNGTEPSRHKVALEFNLENSSPGYYSLSSIVYKANDSNPETLLPELDIVFPFNFSYHCSENLIFSKNTTTLNITDLQIQIDAERFGDAYDCVNFTTIPIWTGIFVTAILGSIMIWALAMIIDIRTMDRFDDPKGKTITISSQE